MWTGVKSLCLGQQTVGPVNICEATSLRVAGFEDEDEAQFGQLWMAVRLETHPRGDDGETFL